jgi:hypothetical protein
MIMKFFLIAAIIATLMIPLNLQNFPSAFTQTSDKSFKGNEPPFIPPPESERIPKAPPSDAVSIKDSPPVGITDSEEEEEVETDKDMLPPLTAREIKELPFDTINDSELKNIQIISNETSSSDPIKSILEKIIKNDSIISNANDIDSFNLSKIKNKFNDTQLEQIFTAQNMSRDSVSVEENNSDIPSNTTADQDDNILSETDSPNPDILNLINNTKVNSNVTETEEQPAITDELSTEGNVTETEGNVTETEGNVTETEEQPAITDELSTEGNVTETEEQPAITDELSTEGNVTETGEQRNEDGSLQGGKSITVEEVPTKTTDFPVEEPTDGNVTIKGQLTNNTIQDSSITTSSELQPLEATGTQDEDQQQQQPLEEEATGTQDEDQQQQQPLEEEATKQVTQDEKKIKVSEICDDELDNDHDGIIDEEHDCLSRTSDSTSTSEKIVPELATLDDDDKDKVKDEANIPTERNSDKAQVTDDSKKSKNKNNELVEEDRTSLESLDPEMQPSGVDILTTTEICNDEMDNDLDASIDEKDCISK